MEFRRCLLSAILSGAVCLALSSSCSDERKKEAAKLEDQLLQQNSPKPETLTTISPATVESTKDVAESSLTPPQNPELRDTAESSNEKHPSETLSNAQEEKTVPDSVSTAREAILSAPRDDAPTRSMPPHPTGDGFTVQIGSTVSRSEADAQVSLYVSRGYDAYVSTVTMNGRDRYRVRIGRFATRREAVSLNSELRNRFSLEGWVDKIAE